MALKGDNKYRDLIDDDGDLGRYQFGRTQHVRARTALSRVNGYLKTMIEAIASSKLRRMERELELRGIRVDRPGNNSVMRKSGPTERSR